MTRPETPASLMAAAAEVARIAGNVALRHFRSPNLEIARKANGSAVTNADLAAETAARDWIRERFPADGILGEEFGMERADAPRRWLLDPIDGTATYVRGAPLWGALVAVMERGEVVAGAAAFPVFEETIWAASGEGCWLNGERQSVSRGRARGAALVLTTDETFSAAPSRRPGWRELARWAGMSRSWGDCYGYLLVATGRAEAMVDPVLSDWDAAALLPIIEEAGGAFTDWAGVRRIDGGSAVATNGELAAEVRRILGVPEAEARS